MNEFDQKEVQASMYMLSKAKNPSEAINSWMFLQNKHPNLCAMIALDDYKKSAVPASVKKYTVKPNDYLVPYFLNENIYFLDDELMSGMLNSGEFKFHIDYTLMFDTNVASYINKLVRGEPLGSVQSKIEALVDDILHDDLNFDHLFYMVENVKNVRRQMENGTQSKLDFWQSLDKNFRNNMVSLQIFRSIDGKEYKKNF